MFWNNTKTTTTTTVNNADYQQTIADTQAWAAMAKPMIQPDPTPVDVYVYVVNKYDHSNDMNFDVAVFTSSEDADAFIERQSHDGYDWDWQEFILDKETIKEEVNA